jgi:hypothetical protein
MTWWSDFAAEQPELARRARALFGVRKHATMATLRADGAPRISGTEVDFAGDDLHIGSMIGALKARDLLRDPRIALHCPTVDAPEDDQTAWEGDAKIAGIAHDVSDGTDAHRFRIEVTEVVLTKLGASGDHLLIEAWHPGRGVRRIERR